MKKYDACIVGYYGMKNSGDDALLAASVWAAENYLDSQKLAVTTPADISVNGYGRVTSTLQARQAYRGQNRFKHYALALQSQRIIFGGGSVFHTAQDINIKRHMMTLSGAGKHLAVGVGLGPFENTQAEKACQKFLYECGYVGLRDVESFQMAKSLAPGANVDLTFDLAPLLLCHPRMPLKELPREGIAVCLCPRERLKGDNKTEKKRIDELAQALINVYANTGETIYLVNLNGHSSLGDQQVHLELQEKLSGSVTTRIIDYDPNPLRLLQRLAGFKAVISMRLHGAILAYLANTPVVSINYHNKCDGWCERIGMPEKYRVDADRIDPFVIADTLIQGLEQGFTQCHLAVDNAINAAKKNWSN